MEESMVESGLCFRHNGVEIRDESVVSRECHRQPTPHMGVGLMGTGHRSHV